MSWMRTLGWKGSKNRQTRKPVQSRRSGHRSRPVRFEALEDRTLLSVAPYQESLSALPGEWIARFDGYSGLPSEQLQAIQTLIDQAALGLTASEYLGLDGMVLLRSVPELEYQPLLAAMQPLPGFLYVEQNHVGLSADGIPTDPSFSSLWGLHNTGQSVNGYSGAVADADIDAPEAWNITTGSSSLVVGVIDSGVDYNHPDLASSIWINPSEIPGNFLDDDGNGYVDDFRGWDFVNNDNNPMDDRDHGTHVAGTIAAAANNGIGVAGVASGVKIMALKFLAADGYGSYANAIKAFNYAKWMKDHGVNIRVTNNSWGGTSYDTALRDAIQANANSGILCVAAAGNSGLNTDYSPHYPSSYPLDNIISVAASDPSDNRARSGYFGSSFNTNCGLTSVDIAAPGVAIYSTVRNNGYAWYNGTSMAAPHVSGVAALAWSVAPNATYQQVREAILSGADHRSTLTNYVATGGRLNAANTLARMGLQVVSSSPAAGQVLITAPTEFTVDFSSPYDPASVDAADFTVNNIAANSFMLVDSDTVTFVFASSPVLAYGLQTMALASGAIQSVGGLDLFAWNATFEYARPSEIRGTKFEDRDGDGVRDANEGPLAGVTVYLDADDDGVLDAGELSQVTNVNGEYVFAQLAPGSYVVREIVPTNYRQTSPAITAGRLFSLNSSQIVELNPQTGNVLRQFSAPYTASTYQGLAFDGNVLYYLSDHNDILYQLNPNTGVVLSQTFMPGAYYDGLAVLGGYVYASDWLNDRIYVINPTTGALVRTMDLRAANPGFNFYGGLGEITGPDSLIATLDSPMNEIAFLDPQTGQITSRFSHGASYTDCALTSIGQEIFVGFGDNKIRVYNRNGVLQGMLSESFTPFSLGGKAGLDGSHRITLGTAETRTGLDFGNQSIFGEIRGTLFADADGDGVQDAGELGHAGVTVYLDLDNDGGRDAGEPHCQTDSEGGYAFGNLLPGSYSVREVLPAGFEQTSPSVDVDTYWGMGNVDGIRRLIKVNAANGQVTTVGNPMSRMMHGLVVTRDGKIYGISGVTGYETLYSIDPQTAAATPVGSTGFELTWGLAYDRAHDVIYCLGKRSASESINKLLVIDRNTGAATEVGPGTTGLTSVSGLTFDPRNNRIIAFDNNDKELVAFDTAGNAQRLATLSGVSTYNLAFHGNSLVYGSGSSLTFANPDNGFRSGSLALSQSNMYFEALDFVPRDPFVQHLQLSSSQIATANFGSRSVVGAIQGTVFVDANGDGVQNPAEIGHQGVTVYLDQNDNGQFDVGEPTQLTDANGSYKFRDVVPGTYFVREVLPADFMQMTPGQGSEFFYASVYSNTQGDRWQLAKIDAQTGQVQRIGTPQTLALRGLVQTKDGTLYGLQGLANEFYSVDPATGVMTRIGHLGFSMAWGMAYDRGTDTIYGLGRLSTTDPYFRLLVIDRATGIATQVGSGPWASGLTGPNGITFDPVLGKVLAYDNADKEIYAFDVASGIPQRLSSAQYNSWCVGHNGQSLVLHNAWTNVLYYVDPATGATTGSLLMSESLALDSLERAPATPFAHRVVVGKSVTAFAPAFGNRSTLGEIHGTLFLDVDGDGLRDAGEAGHAGVTVYLDLNDNGSHDPEEPTQVTDGQGTYQFTNVRPGSYAVREVVPEGFSQTLPGEGTAGYLVSSVYVTATTSRFVKVDPTTGAVIFQASTVMPKRMHGLIETDDGSVFAVNADSSDDWLYRVNPTTGEATPVGATGAELAWGLTYDRATDAIYALGQIKGTTGINRLLTIDRVTGQATAIGPENTSLQGPCGLAFDPIRGRILAFGNTGKEFYAYDTSGNWQRLSSFSTSISSFGSLAYFNGQAAIGYGTGMLLVNPDTGTIIKQVPVSWGVGGYPGGLEFVPSDPYVRRVTLTAGQSIVVGDFGNTGFPIANAGGPYTVGEGGGLELNATGSWDTDGGTLVYTWDLDGDGLFGETGIAAQRGNEVGASPLFSAELLNDGVVTVRLRVTDILGNIDEATAAISVTNIAPVILSAEVVPDVLGEGRNSTLFLHFADPGANDTHRITIDWGDGSAPFVTILNAGLVGQPYSHTYLDDKPSGTDSDAYIVRVTVTDSAGAVAETLGIKHRTQLHFENSYTFDDALVHHFDQFTKDGYTIRTASGAGFEIDGSKRTGSYGRAIARVPTPGETVILTRDDGQAFTFRGIGIHNPFSDGVPKRVTFTGVRIDGSRVIETIDTASNAESYVFRGFTDVVSVSWVASQEAGYSPAYRFDDVVAMMQEPQSDETTVVVKNTAPRISRLAVEQGTIAEGGTVTLTGDFIDPGTQDTHQLFVEWGDGQTTSLPLSLGSRSFTLTHQYLDNLPAGAVASIQVTVRDDDGGSDTSGEASVLTSTAWDFEEWAYSTRDFLTTGEFAKEGYSIIGQSFNVIGPFDPYSVGSTALLSPQNRNIILRKDDGGLFTLASIDVAEIPVPQRMPAYVTYTGTRADGSTVVKNVQTDNIIGFERIVFEGFTDLVQLTWRGQDPVTWHYGGFHQFKNVVLEGWSNPVSSPVVAINNVAPTALDDSIETVEDQAIAIAVLANDSDPASVNDPLRIEWLGSPSHGTVEIDDSGTPSDPTDDRIIYTPSAGYSGTDSFLYTVNDGDGGTATGTVFVTVRNLVDLSGRVFDDRDNDGLYEPEDGDQGIAGVTVEVWDEAMATRFAWATTSSDGRYLLDANLREGTYRIVETPAQGYLDGKETAGTLGGTSWNGVESDRIDSILIGAPGANADGEGYDFAELRPASVHGLVWDDFTGDGLVDLGEEAIAGVPITLIGLDDRGNQVLETQTTNADGIFEFIGLRPGAYSVVEAQPAGFADGLEVLGEVVEPAPGVVLGHDGTIAADGDAFDGIQLVAGSAAINYNFAERLDGGTLSTGQTAGIGFWQNKNGQDLIRSLNGEGSTLLGTWLAETFPNIYGGGILDRNGDGRIVNDEVAETYRLLFKRNGQTSPGGSPKLDAQVMAVALASFITKEGLGGLIYDSSHASNVDFLFDDANGDGLYSLADGDTARTDLGRVAAIERYGFDVTEGGVGSRTYNVGTRGDAFGVADGTDLRIIDLLLATDRMSWRGLLYDTNQSGVIGDDEDGDEALLRTLANDVYCAINESGQR